MIMIVDLAGAEVDLSVLREILSTQGKVKGLTVTVQHEDVFQFMHRI
jgi:ACT domain-containing protein